MKCLYILQPAFNIDPPTYASHIAKTTAMPHHSCLLIEMNLTNFFPRLDINCNPPALHYPSHLDYRHELPCCDQIGSFVEQDDSKLIWN